MGLYIRLKKGDKIVANVPTIYRAAKNSPKIPPKSRDDQARRLDTVEIVKEEFGHRTKNPLAAFSILPHKVSFETQEIKEQIVLLLRKHWITNLPWMAVTLLMLAAPAFLKFFPLLEFLPARFQFITVVIWYMFVLAYVLESFLSWYFNVYIITDERFIDVDFYSLIYKRISEAKLDRIQDVSYSQGGIIQALFNFGTVTVQTAGEIPEFELEAVPQPARITKVLNQLLLQEEQEKLEGRVS